MSQTPPTSPYPQIMPRPSRATVESIMQANLISNQSIYANTVTLPKIGNAGQNDTQHSRQSASPVRHGSNASNGSSNKSNKSNNGHNTSKLSSSNSPATTNQTNTSYMDSSKDHSPHELENTQLSPIAGRASCPEL